MTPMRTAIVTSLVFATLVVASAADAQRRRPQGRPNNRPTPAATPEPAATPPAEPPVSADVPAVDPNAAPAPAPAPTDAAATATPTPAEEVPMADLAPLREEFTSLMDDLVETRARIATLGRSLFHTRLRINIQNRAGDLQALAHIAVFIDGAPVYRAEGSEFNGEDGRQVFEGFAAPGPHAIVIEVEQRSRDGEGYRYTLRDNYRFEVLRDKLTDVTAVLDDDSGIGEDFPDDQEGEYDVRTRVRVATREIDAR